MNGKARIGASIFAAITALVGIGIAAPLIVSRPPRSVCHHNERVRVRVGGVTYDVPWALHPEVMPYRLLTERWCDGDNMAPVVTDDLHLLPHLGAKNLPDVAVIAIQPIESFNGWPTKESLRAGTGDFFSAPDAPGHKPAFLSKDALIEGSQVLLRIQNGLDFNPRSPMLDDVRGVAVQGHIEYSVLLMFKNRKVGEHTKPDDTTAAFRAAGNLIAEMKGKS